MFPLDFPLGALAEGRPGEWVLDPFCGRGTTLFAARKLGMPSVGIDSNAVAAAIAQAYAQQPHYAAEHECDRDVRYRRAVGNLRECLLERVTERVHQPIPLLPGA